MKFVCISLVLFFIGSWGNIIPAQQLDSTINAYRTAFAVPDAPAFKLLNTEPSSLMRPGSARAVAVAISNFFLSGQPLPSAFAAECSPYLLAAGNSLTLHEYLESGIQRALFRVRISFASQRSSAAGSPTKVAAGIRITLRDDADLRTDLGFLNSIIHLTDTVAAIQDRYRTAARPSIGDYIKLSETEKEALRVHADSLAQPEIARYEKQLTDIRETAQEHNWQKTLIEVGIAIAGTSRDSIGTSGMVSSSIALWFTATGAINTWGQWVLGCNPRLERDSSTVRLHCFQAPLAARLYAGQNSYKGFLEINANWFGAGADSYLLQIGTETKLYNLLWVDMGVGIHKIGSADWALTSVFNVRLDP